MVFLFVLFLLAIILSVSLRFTDSDYTFSIFKLFLANENEHNTNWQYLHIHLVIFSFISISISWSCTWTLAVNPLELQEEYEDIEGVIRIRISKRNRQHIGICRCPYFCVQCVKVKGDCSFCWYWMNCLNFLFTTLQNWYSLFFCIILVVRWVPCCSSF